MLILYHKNGTAHAKVSDHAAVSVTLRLTQEKKAPPARALPTDMLSNPVVAEDILE